MDVLLDSINKSLAEYYRDRADKFDLSSQQVGWKSDEAQRRRFDQLLKLFETPSGFSLNDFGCGHGDLVDFVSERGFYEFVYTGYDLFSSMVERAREIHGKKKDCGFVTIQQPH